MIYVRVGQHDRVEIFDRKRQRPIFFRSFLSFALKHPAIQGNVIAVYMKDVAGTGDFTCCTDKGYLQPSAFCYCITLEQNYQALAILGHQCWLPPTPASLVQKIRKRVFILPRMPSELDYDSLVFFHR